MSNIFSKIPFHATTLEISEPIFDFGGIYIERIISTGQATPEGEWYDQERHEWVMILTGCAGIKLEQELDLRILRAGDYLFIPAHCKHRVEWTAENERTIWLALFFEPNQSNTPNLAG